MNNETGTAAVAPGNGDALVVVDLQRDFLPGGALGVTEGDQVVPVINRCIERFRREGLPVVASRDWHPPDHCSFQAQGGPWPPHCVAGTDGALFAADLRLPDGVMLVSKATTTDKDAYSAFEGTRLAADLRARGVHRVFVAGLATDYCVLNTALDARRHGFEVVLIADGVRAVELAPGDGERAVARMREAGCLVVPGDAVTA
jgi:nicotinamidase/pyrazinamidase